MLADLPSSLTLSNLCQRHVKTPRLVCLSLMPIAVTVPDSGAGVFANMEKNKLSTRFPCSQSGLPKTGKCRSLGKDGKQDKLQKRIVWVQPVHEKPSRCQDDQRMILLRGLIFSELSLAIWLFKLKCQFVCVNCLKNSTKSFFYAKCFSIHW